MSEQLLECIGVPEYFATTTRLEDAGGGNVRIFNCIKRNGVLIPSCSVIFPTASILKIVQQTHDFAR
ncbi:MAG: hypothetical protein Q8M03_04220, partial [Legionella sp.]|nr:hypothetical protein [Legionella sp.]